MVATKGSSSIAIGATVSFLQTDNALDRQYVSDPLAAQTILAATTFTAQLMVREFALSDNVDTGLMCVRLVSNDGSTVRATLWSMGGYGTVASEFINNATCRNFTFGNGTGDCGTYGDSGGGNYTVTDGDRLVLEIGYNINASLGTTPQAAAKYGENATDLPANDTQTTDDACEEPMDCLRYLVTRGARYIAPGGKIKTTGGGAY